MDKAGILGSWIYFGGVYIAHYFVIHQYKELPSSDLLFLIIGIPALLFLIKPPIIFFLQKKADPGKKLSIITLFNFLLEWLIEMLEIFSGYLANTLSFMRVAGLGIAHACLMIAFFEMAGMAGGGIWSVIILIIGNLLVIALEGLSAGIQSLRLNYYEFFSKYFTGTGMAYSPVSLYRR
jgi:V/A-type H+-transporting ATPase subunit I